MKFLKKLFGAPAPQATAVSPTSQGLRKDGRPNTKYRRRGWAPHPGTERNPLLDYPRNLGCFCGSEQKAKHCCLPFQQRAGKSLGVQILRDNWEKIISGEVFLPPAPGSHGAKVFAHKERKEEQQKEMLADLKKETA